jgi:glycosyltransferase involved in cell wall biosynthesis
MGNTNDRLDGVYVVIAAFNETQAIAAAIQNVARFVPVGCIIVVDDASSDATAEAARSQNVHLLRHLINRGQGAALATGIEYALTRGARIIVTFDADGQHNADDIPNMVKPLIDGDCDVVLGSRFLTGNPPTMPPFRKLILQVGTIITRIISNIRVTDTHNGFRAFSSNAAKTIHIRQDRMAHASEILEQISRHRLRFVERHVNIRYSDYSMSKGQRNRDALKILARVILDKVIN